MAAANFNLLALLLLTPGTPCKRTRWLVQAHHVQGRRIIYRQCGDLLPSMGPWAGLKDSIGGEKELCVKFSYAKLQVGIWAIMKVFISQIHSQPPAGCPVLGGTVLQARQTQSLPFGSSGNRGCWSCFETKDVELGM